jgi:vacuolar-type H+-ATPase subunit F/Vma7
MSAPCYIGDEASAAGFRLAGAQVLVPRVGEEAAALAAARIGAALILVSAETAARIPADLLEQAHAALTPLTLIVPDLFERIPVPDLAARLRRELGLEETR